MSELKQYVVELIKEEQSSVFKATNKAGYSINIDGIGVPNGQSVSPIEMVVQAAGACSGVDILEILKSDSKKIESFKMKVTGSRDVSETPAYLREICIEYFIEGDINLDKLNRTIELSLEKYCTVGKTLEAFAKIKWSLQLNGQLQTPIS